MFAPQKTAWLFASSGLFVISKDCAVVGSRTAGGGNSTTLLHAGRDCFGVVQANIIILISFRISTSLITVWPQ